MLKKKIALSVLLIIAVIGGPIALYKGIEIAELREVQVRENKNKETYKEANVCMDSGEYEKAVRLLEKLPEDYEDAAYIVCYAEFCQGVENNEEIEQLYRLTWNFPSESSYNGKYAEKMRNAEREIRTQYKEYEAQEERKKREEIKKDMPYKGMEEKYINDTILGNAQEKREEHYWRDTPRQRTQDIQYRYMWYGSYGNKKFMAVCRNGRVSSVVKFEGSSSTGYANSYRENNNSKDMFDVYDYDDPEDFYYDHIDEFDDIQDAEDYWEEAQ